VKGNEQADKLAKEAATGKASRQMDLPPILHRTLPNSASATKQHHLKQLKSRWKLTWLDSPRHCRFKQVDNSFPFTGYQKQQEKLTRQHASLMVQVWSRHFSLNSFLFKIGKSETRLCQECQVEQEEDPPVETVDHFIFHCNAYTNQR